MTVAYDLSSKSTTIVFNPSVGEPILLSGFAENDIIEFDNLELADAGVGADGTLFTYVKPGIVSGRIKFIATAPAVTSLTNFTNIQNQVGYSVLGSVLISTLGWSTSYTNWIWTSGFAGFTEKTMLQPQVWGFKAAIPDLTNLTSAASLIQSALGF